MAAVGDAQRRQGAAGEAQTAEVAVGAPVDATGQRQHVASVGGLPQVVLVEVDHRRPHRVLGDEQQLGVGLQVDAQHLAHAAVVAPARELEDAAALEAPAVPGLGVAEVGPTLVGLAGRVLLERLEVVAGAMSVGRGLVGTIISRIEHEGFRIRAMRRVSLSRNEAEGFYAVHKERPFFGELVEFMTSGPVVVQVIEGDNAIARYREIMGATDPAKAADGTIRKLYAKSVGENSVHGSDAADTAAKEIAQNLDGYTVIVTKSTVPVGTGRKVSEITVVKWFGFFPPQFAQHHLRRVAALLHGDLRDAR